MICNLKFLKRHKISQELCMHRRKEDTTKLNTSEKESFNKKVEIINENFKNEKSGDLVQLTDPYKSKIFRLDSTDILDKNESNSKTCRYTTVYKCCCGRHSSVQEKPNKEKSLIEESFYDKIRHSYTCTCGWCNLTKEEEEAQDNVEIQEYHIKYCCCGGKCKPQEPGS